MWSAGRRLCCVVSEAGTYAARLRTGPWGRSADREPAEPAAQNPFSPKNQPACRLQTAKLRTWPFARRPIRVGHAGFLGYKTLRKLAAPLRLSEAGSPRRRPADHIDCAGLLGMFRKRAARRKFRGGRRGPRSATIRVVPALTQQPIKNGCRRPTTATTAAAVGHRLELRRRERAGCVSRLAPIRVGWSWLVWGGGGGWAG